MKSPQPKVSIIRFITSAALAVTGFSFANEQQGLLFSPDADIWGAQPVGHYQFIFDNREYSPLPFPSPEERTVFGQNLRLGLTSRYENVLEIALGFRLWNSFGEPLATAMTLSPDIHATLTWDEFSFLGGQFRIDELHPSVFYQNPDAPDLPGIKLHAGNDDWGGSLFLARTQVPGNFRYETYAGGGQFWRGNERWLFDHDYPLKDSLRLQWSGVHQAGFDTGGQHYLVPPGARKKESYAALLMDSLSLYDWLRLAPMAGGTLSREDNSKGFMSGLEADLGLELGATYLVAELSGWYLGKNLHSYWARDDFAIMADPEKASASDNTWLHERYMPGAAIKLYLPVDYFWLGISIDEKWRFLDELGKNKEWDRNQVVIQFDLLL